MPLIEEVESDGESNEEEVEEPDDVKKERLAQRQREKEAEARRVQGQFDLCDGCKAEGSKLFADGKLEEACLQWDDAIRHLYKVGNLPDDRAKADTYFIALHLNMAQAYLKMEKFETAKEQADRAWAIDQKNIKALYRRALAQACLARKATLFQEAEAKGACEDLAELLKIEPSNAAAIVELKKLRAEMKAHADAEKQKQKETWGQVFGGKAEGEDIPEGEALPNVRPAEMDNRHCWVQAEGIEVGRGPVLGGVSLNCIEKWCVGIYAQDKDDAAKAALVDVISRKIAPSKGTFTYPKKVKRGVNPDEVWHVNLPGMLATVVGGIALIGGAIQYKVDYLMGALIFLIVVMIVPLVVYLWYEQQVEKRPPIIITMTRNGCKEWKPAGKTVVEALEGALPKKLEKKEKSKRAVALLRAGGLEEEQDSTSFADLSEDQKQIVYILRCLVVKSKVTIVDDALRDLEPASQSRMLRMIKRMKQDCNASILFLSSDMQILTLICDSLGMILDGQLIELGPTDEVLVRPRHPDMAEAIAKSNIKDGQSAIVKGCGSTAEFFNDLLQDSALGAMWLPKDDEYKKA